MAVPLERFAEADFLVMPIDAEQRRLAPAEVTEYLSQRPAEMVIPVGGLDYVRVFRLPKAEFGRSVRIERQRVERTRHAPG